MDSFINTRLRELEHLDKSREVAHLRRKEWPKDFDVKSALWQVPKATADILIQLVTEKQPRTILELGTSAGYSGLLMLQAAPLAHLHTIEFSPYRFSLAKESFAQTNTASRVMQYNEKISAVLARWTRKLDFVFIDANKPKYLENFKLIEPFLNEGAVVLVDNMLDDRKKTDPLLKYAQKSAFSADLLSIDNGILIIRK